MKKISQTLPYILAIISFITAICVILKGDTSLGYIFVGFGFCMLGMGSIFTSRARNEQFTLKYYNENAQDFVDTTVNADMSETRDRFTNYLPENACILDWGCGSGRDSKAFKEMGYTVDAVDGSEEMCKLAVEQIGQPVACQKFAELDAKEKYDGIWACASLLHVGRDSQNEIYEKAAKALKPGGYMYASYKYGDMDKEKAGRYFTNMTEKRFAKVLKNEKNLEIVDQWTTEDVRPGRSEKWLNVIMKKRIILLACALTILSTGCTNKGSVSPEPDETKLVEEVKEDKEVQEEKVVQEEPAVTYSEAVLAAQAFMEAHCGGEYEDIKLLEVNGMESYVSFSEVETAEATNYAKYGIATYTLGILYDSSCISATDNEYIFLQEGLYYKILIEDSSFEMYIGNDENDINDLAASCIMD